MASENLIIFFSISRSSGVHGSMHDKTEYSKLSAKKCLMSDLITKKKRLKTLPRENIHDNAFKAVVFFSQISFSKSQI